MGWLVAIALVLSTCVTPAVAASRLDALALTVGDGQGVYAVSGDGTVLVEQAADRAVHPASVTKIATTLALLERLGPTYRFVTEVTATGPIRDGRLAGDLVIHGAGDPFLIDESAHLLATRLHAHGVAAVAGRLVVEGPLIFDWQPDGDGRRLRKALATAPHDAVAFAGETVAPSGPERLAVYASPPLLTMVKAFNGYSNNVFHLAADAIGGVAVVQSTARAHVPESMRDEIILDNGAGAGTTNRLSPRAAVALLGALATELARTGHDLPDALPVSGRDAGTLAERLPELRGVIVGKTGTFGSVGASALVGAVRSRHDGIVRFAVLNHDVPVPEARARQDAFVRALVEAVGGEPWPYVPAGSPPIAAATID